MSVTVSTGSVSGILKYPDGKVITLTAGANVTKGRALHLTSENTVAHADGTKPVVGIAGSSANSGDPVPVITRGIVVATAGGSITAGSYVIPTTDGKVIEYTPVDISASPTDTEIENAIAEALKVFAVALTSASGDGDEVVIRLL